MTGFYRNNQWHKKKTTKFYIQKVKGQVWTHMDVDTLVWRYTVTM